MAAKGQAKAPAMKVRKGDRVIVLSGRDSGAEGKVIAVYPERRKVLVEGVNMVKKNKKVTMSGGTMRPVKEGGIVHQEAPIDVSNVALIDPDTKQPARVGYRFDEDGRKIRVTRPGGKEI